MKVIVGLGNPGKKYEQTRHNIGFEAVSRIAKRWQADQPRRKHESLVAECRIGTEKSLLVWPQTFMNASGSAVRSVTKFYKTPLEDLLVVSDDFNLELGKLRLKVRGSAGGQNGLKDIILQLGDDEFPRLRLGIGPAPAGRDVTGFVLGRFSPGEKEAAAELAETGANAIEAWATKGADTAMNQYN
ncbi:MAG: aminoacyl-tRNA hydrolase [Planctomycetota bacterium]